MEKELKIDGKLNEINLLPKDNDGAFLLEAAVKGLSKTIPVIGDITSFFFEIQAKRKQDRLICFVNDLSLDLESLKEQINLSFMVNDDFLDVFETSTKYIINERSEAKRKNFKNILKNSIVDLDADYDKTEKYLRIVDNLDEIELLILKIFDNPSRFNFENGSAIGRYERNKFDKIPMATDVLKRLLPSYSSSDITIAWNDLESKWLINVSITPPSTEPILGPLDILENRLSIKGRELVNYILR